ncbi:MAG: cation diffusion facilitator family transporter, partial [Eubacteriales bacterium]
MDENIQKRERTIVRASMAGILANLLLSIFKAVMGISTNSIAILLDAVNNISDALSSIVTIIGIKLAGKAPDKEHPFGHGRIEYITTVVISGFVLYAGITALIESVKQIIHPEIPNYSNAALIIMLVSMIVKAILSIFFTRISKKVN